MARLKPCPSYRHLRAHSSADPPSVLSRFRLIHLAVGKGILGYSDLGFLRLIHPTKHLAKRRRDMGHPLWWVIWSCSCGKVEFLVTPAVAGAKSPSFSTRYGATKKSCLIQGMSFFATC